MSEAEFVVWAVCLGFGVLVFAAWYALRGGK